MGCFCWQHWKYFEDPDIRLGKVFFFNEICNDLELNGLNQRAKNSLEWKASRHEFGIMQFLIKPVPSEFVFTKEILKKEPEYILKIRICITANLKNISTFWFWYFVLNFPFKIILMGHDTNQKIIGLMVAWRNGRSLATCEKYRKVVLNWNKQY